jgi:hypothetical protein
VVAEVVVVGLVVVVVVGLSVGLLGRAGLFGLWLQTTLQVQPSVLPTPRPSLKVLNTSFTVLFPENLRLAVLLPQYFLWKVTAPPGSPFMTLR